MKLSKRIFAGLATASLAVTVTACGGSDSSGNFDDTVTVGILHSLSGTMAISESTLVDTEKMAIEEINAAGGVTVDGKSYKIEYIVEDGASDWPTFAEKSKKLIDQDKVPLVFGGWTSASRKAMLPVYESKDAFLYYPIQYEAQECSNNIFYTGATPNQQSEPATDFMYKRSPAAGGDFFLVGSDYVFPRTSNTITKAQVINSNKCISYLTIENKKSIPKELQKNMSGYIFGCDICQDVCPWNRFSKAHNEEDFLPNQEIKKYRKKDWIELTEETFNVIFKGSAVKRTKYSGLKRNIKTYLD